MSRVSLTIKHMLPTNSPHTILLGIIASLGTYAAEAYGVSWAMVIATMMRAIAMIDWYQLGYAEGKGLTWEVAPKQCCY